MKLPEITAHLRHTVQGNLVKRILCCCSCAVSKDKITTLKQARGSSGVFRCGIYANASNAASFDRHRRARCRISVKGGTTRWMNVETHFGKLCVWDTQLFGEIIAFQLMFYFVKWIYVYELMKIRFSRFFFFFFLRKFLSLKVHNFGLK